MGIRAVLLGAAVLAVAACSGGAATVSTPTSVIRAAALLSNTVAFMGDSVTQDWPVSAYDTTNPTQNFGITGQTSVEMLARFDAVLSSGAGVVVIEAGINDLYFLGPAANTASIAAMAAQANAAGMRVILCSLLPDSYAYATGKAPVTADILAMNDRLLKLAQAQGYLYADYYDALLLPDGTQDISLIKDGLHPNDAGYVKLWAVLKPLIAEDLQVSVTAATGTPG